MRLAQHTPRPIGRGTSLVIADQLAEQEEGEVTRHGFVDSFFHSTVLATVHQRDIILWDDAADPPQPLIDRSEVAEVLRSDSDLALTCGAMPIPEIRGSVNGEANQPNSPPTERLSRQGADASPLPVFVRSAGYAMTISRLRRLP